MDECYFKYTLNDNERNSIIYKAKYLYKLGVFF